MYDRLHAREVARLVRYLPNVADGQWYDVLTGRVRRREMMDDFRDLTANQTLDVSIEEQGRRYFSGQDIHLQFPRDGVVVNWLADVVDGISGAQR